MKRVNRETIRIPFLKEDAFRYSYDNGFTFIHVPKSGDVFNVSTWVATGSIHEDDRINGISHFLEHLMFKGTERFKPGEFDRAMESMGAIINAATWKDFTFYYITGPSGQENKNFEKALDMHGDMMTCSVIPEAEIGPPYDPEDPDYAGEKRERSVVIEEIGMREDQPWTKVYNALNSMMYPEGHPYRRDVIGTRQIIGKIPRQTIVDYYNRWYSAPNFTTIVVGDFDPDWLEGKVLEAFRFEEKAPEGMDYDFPEPTANGNRFSKQAGDYMTSFLISGYHGPSPRNFEETIAMDIVSYALGEGRSSRLQQELIDKPENPVFNFIGCGQSHFRLGNVFFIQGNFSAEDHDKALAQVDEQVRRLLNDAPVTQEEMDRAVKKLKVAFAETSETSSGIADVIGESLTVVNDLDYYLKYLDVLEGLDLETVNATARKYLAPEKSYTSVMVHEHAHA